jgi:hypothetical protein
MAISGGKMPFAKEQVDKSPDLRGVYALYDGNELIYYGRADGKGVTIRSRLKSHLAGNEGECLKGATHYRREPTERPIVREKALLEAFRRENGRLPRCNERTG